MNNESKFYEKSEITIEVLLACFKKFLFVIIAATVLLGAVSGVYAKFFTKTKYSATIEFVVVNVLDENPYISDSMLGAASDITATCVEIVNKNVLLSKAVEKHSLDEFYGLDKHDSVDKMSSMVSAQQSSEESSVFSVSVLSESSEVTYKTITALQDVMPAVVEELYKLSDSSSITTTIKPVTVVDEISDVKTVKTSALKYTAIGAAIGLALSYVIAIIIYLSDTKVYDDSTIKSNFAAPVIGVIPEWNVQSDDEGKDEKKKKRVDYRKQKRNYRGKLLTSETPFGVAEAFNSLRTNICYSTSEVKCPVFAVTSDFSGAGKSVISANISTSLAMLGKKTLLIECDLRRPELGAIFDISPKFGLSDYLAGEVRDEKEIFVSMNQENLDVVFSGRIPPNPSELLGSDVMIRFVESCKEHYDIIIVDTPPAFEVADIGIIAPLVSGVVIVARSRYSDVNAIKNSIETIGGVSGKITGFVVNDVNYKTSGYYRNKKYGYRRYGKYYKYSSYSDYSGYGESEKQ